MSARSGLFRMVGLLAALTLIRCGGGGGGSSTSTPPPPAQEAPTSLKATLYAPPGTFHLTWTKPNTSFDGYEFEGQKDLGMFSKLHDGLIPNTWTEAYHDAGQAGPVPELTTFTFRVRVMRGTTPSAYSNEASSRTGILAPYLSAYTVSGSIDISWTNHSLVADTLKLERGVEEGTNSTWTTIPEVAFGMTSWVDRAAPEGASCVYRVTYSKGQDSAQATSYPVTVPMVPPIDVKATPQVEGVSLTWQNPSTAATEVAVMRASGLDSYGSFEQVALLPIGTTAYTDLQLATGFYTYRLENRKTGVATASSASVQVVTLPPQNGASVFPTILTLPQAQVARRSSQGTWFLSDAYGWNVTVREPSGSGWLDYTPPSAQYWASPYFLLDSQDHPHMIYTRSVVQGAQEVALMHAWKDATGWQTEEIARRTLYSNSSSTAFTFALDATDKPHVLWLNSGGQPSDLEYAVKDAQGTWITEFPVTFTTASGLGSYRLLLDPTGQPHILVGAWQELFHLTRTSASTWSSETVPAPGASVGWYDFVAGAAGGPDTVLVLACRTHQPYDGSYDLMLYRKKDGVWLPEEVVLTTSGYTTFNGTFAASADATRFGLYHSTSGGTALNVWTAGTWTSSLVGPNSYGAPTLGFDASDKLYLLVPAGWGSTTSAYPYVLYQEKP